MKKEITLKCDVCGKFRKINDLESVHESDDTDYSNESIYLICKKCQD